MNFFILFLHITDLHNCASFPNARLVNAKLWDLSVYSASSAWNEHAKNLLVFA